MKTRLFGSLLLFCLILVAAGAGMADEPLRVVIVPFKMNADSDLSFLQEGIVDMLTSRLSSESSVVVEREDTASALQDLTEPVSEKTARAVGAKLEADYVLFGSLTMFGNSISLDAKLVDVHEKKPALTLFDQGTKVDDVIPQINLFATEINEKAFGRALRARKPAEQAREHRGLYAHPETMMAAESQGQAWVPRQRPARTAGPGFEEIQGVPRADTAGSWKSKNFKMAIKGLSVGDVDGDDKTEVVFITDDEVYVYRFEKNRFFQVKQLTGKGQKFIGVDVADVNGNGYAEIFVTSLTGSGQRLDSFVLESDGDGFTRISEDAWYYRIIDMPDEGKVLIGQKRRMEDLFVPGVFRLAWAGGKYEPQGRIQLPKGVNIFGFAMGDVMNNGQQWIVAFDESDHLRVFSLSGEEQWKSDEPYGGSMNYLEFRSDSGRGDNTDRLYLPQRIFVRDVNGDAKNEVVVATNQGSLGRLFATFRKFSSGRTVVLAWSSSGLVPMWQTTKMSGHVSDCAIGDFDNDGADEVVAAHAAKQGTMITAARSSIVAYELTQPLSARH